MQDQVLPASGRSVTLHRTRRGVVAHFEGDTVVGISLATYGEWGEHELACVRPYVAPGDVVIDVGANVGTHTLAFAEMVGTTGRVVAFEADPTTHALLCHNIVANGLVGRVNALSVLAGAGPAVVPSTLLPPSENAGTKSFFVDVHGRDVHGTAVEHLPPPGAGLPIRLAMMTVDDLALPTCALIKIDVEGMELDVLRGARDTLRRTGAAVYFEQVGGASARYREIAALLRDLGYRLFWHTAGVFNPGNHHGRADDVFGGAAETNVLALPRGVEPPDGLVEAEQPGPAA